MMELLFRFPRFEKCKLTSMFIRFCEFFRELFFWHISLLLLWLLSLWLGMLIYDQYIPRNFKIGFKYWHFIPPCIYKSLQKESVRGTPRPVTEKWNSIAFQTQVDECITLFHQRTSSNELVIGRFIFYAERAHNKQRISCGSASRCEWRWIYFRDEANPQ